MPRVRLPAAGSLDSSPVRNRVFSSRSTSPGGRARVEAHRLVADGRLAEPRPATTAIPRDGGRPGRANTWPSGFPFGRPRWERRITFAPRSVEKRIVGSAARIRVSSVIRRSPSSGTLKSTRTRARFPVSCASLRSRIDAFRATAGRASVLAVWTPCPPPRAGRGAGTTRYLRRRPRWWRDSRAWPAGGNVAYRATAHSPWATTIGLRGEAMHPGVGEQDQQRFRAGPGAARPRPRSRSLRAGRREGRGAGLTVVRRSAAPGLRSDRRSPTRCRTSPRPSPSSHR